MSAPWKEAFITKGCVGFCLKVSLVRTPLAARRIKHVENNKRASISCQQHATNQRAVKKDSRNAQSGSGDGLWTFKKRGTLQQNPGKKN